jgi:hypothetical protein
MSSPDRASVTREPAAATRAATQAATLGAPTSSDVEMWLARLGLTPLDSADREGVTAWDLELDGRRRFGLPVTVILDRDLGVICWAHYAPPIGDGFRRSYRKLLRWNDELPFVKFSLAEDGRPVLTTELPVDRVDEDALGLALARMVLVADQLLDDSAEWLWIGGKAPANYGQGESRNRELLARFGPRLAELFET